VRTHKLRLLSTKFKFSIPARQHRPGTRVLNLVHVGSYCSARVQQTMALNLVDQHGGSTTRGTKFSTRFSTRILMR
jgi:hypothetical protein